MLLQFIQFLHSNKIPEGVIYEASQWFTVFGFPVTMTKLKHLSGAPQAKGQRGQGDHGLQEIKFLMSLEINFGMYPIFWRQTYNRMICLQVSSKWTVTTCYNMLQHVTTCYNMLQRVTTCYNMLQHVTTCYNHHSSSSLCSYKQKPILLTAHCRAIW